jgi:hypothetical protein
MYNVSYQEQQGDSNNTIVQTIITPFRYKKGNGLGLLVLIHVPISS